MQSGPSARVCAAQVSGHGIRLVPIARVIFVASALLPGYDKFTCLQKKQPGKSSSGQTPARASDGIFAPTADFDFHLRRAVPKKEQTLCLQDLSQKKMDVQAQSSRFVSPFVRPRVLLFASSNTRFDI